MHFAITGIRIVVGVAFGHPMFVTKILPESNTVILGTQEELKKSVALVRGVNLIKYASIQEPLEAITKIRYKDAGAHSTIVQEDGLMKVEFHHAVSGIAPGQSAVFYEGNDLLGGGFLL